MKRNLRRPRILALDIETSPILAWVWKIWDENIGLEQIERDWHILSWAAKWISEPNSKIMYMDQRNARDMSNDKKILQAMWNLLDQADIVLTQNGKRFDIKKLNARFVMHGMKPPSKFLHIDTLQVTKKNFAFTSHKLQFMTDKLCPENKKSSHKSFPGFSLWKECLKGNKKAWKEMEKYNKQDVEALQSLYEKVKAWDTTFNINVFHEGLHIICECGSGDFKRDGHNYTNTGKFQRHRCKGCGKPHYSKINLLSKEKRASLRE